MLICLFKQRYFVVLAEQISSFFPFILIQSHFIFNCRIFLSLIHCFCLSGLLTRPLFFLSFIHSWFIYLFIYFLSFPLSFLLVSFYSFYSFHSSLHFFSLLFFALFTLLNRLFWLRTCNKICFINCFITFHHHIITFICIDSSSINSQLIVN